jgi:hypothetical protein
LHVGPGYENLFERLEHLIRRTRCRATLRTRPLASGNLAEAGAVGSWERAPDPPGSGVSCPERLSQRGTPLQKPGRADGLKLTRDDLETMLIRMDLDYDEVDEGMFLVKPKTEGSPPVVVHVTPPLLLIRVKVMDLPDEGGSRDLYQTLLELNATDVVHGAYGIEDGEVIISDTLELDTLDFEELQASVESVLMAVSSHLQKIKALAGTNHQGA